MNGKGNHVGGRWLQGGGPDFHSTDPATGLAAWAGRESDARDVETAVDAARKAFPAWSAMGPEQRAGYLQGYAARLK